jgi:outer membrane protein assembly factor BamB
MSKWRDVVWRAVRLSGLAIVIASAAGWQLRARIVGPVGNPDNPDAKDSPEGVYVPESELAMERLALAQKMERLKEWNKSADLYQEILTDPKYAAKVVPAEGDADHRLYRSVEELVMQRLAHWPQEGLDVYRGRYETPASTLLESSKGNDLNVLHEVFARYFVTAAGKTAGIRLTDRYLEAGEFRAAAAIADRLLHWHPNLADDRPALFFRAAVAYHLVGDDHEAQAHLSELKKRDPQARGIVRGSDVVLADALAKELAEPVPVASGANGDSYTTFGGDVSRNRVVAVSGTPGAHLYSIQLPKITFGNSQQAASLESRYREDVKSGLTLGVMPVVDRGELFFQDGQRVYGVDLESGVPLSEWVKNNGADHGGAFRISAAGEASRSRQLTLTVTDRFILAVMGQQDANMYARMVVQPSDTKLVCLDRQTGRPAWMIQMGQLKQESLRNLQLGGSPLVVGDNVCVVGTAVKQAGFEECDVLCFALSKGALRWATNIASASTLSQPFGGFNTGFYLAPNNSHPAYANGRVFVQTNRGAMAAVDVYNGMIDWLATYSRGQQATNPAFNPMAMVQRGEIQNQTKPWTYNPVLASQGLVFTLPVEGKNLLIYDAATGRLVKQIDLQELGQRLRSDEVEPPNFDTLVGVSGDALVLASKKSVVVIDWRAFDNAHFNEDKMTLWEEGFPSEIRGRPFLTQDRVYVATEQRMFMIDMKTGVAEKDYPAWPRTWADDEGPGNLVVTSDHAIIAGAEHIDVYTDLAAAKAKLDREVAQSPGDPQPRLRYAEVTYAAGDYATSMAKLDEAIERAGGDKLQPGPIRDRIFNDALTFAQKLKNDDRPDGQQRIAALFDRAAQAAHSPEQQVDYRVARAGFEQARNDTAAAVELYQQILSQPQWRSVSLPDEANKMPASADVIARNHIAQLIVRDPAIYAKFEAEASEALQKAEQTSEPAALLAVAQAYPNSSVAGRAMLAAAHAYENGGQPRLARHVLLDIYFDRDRRAADRSDIVEALARTDLRSAAHVLRQAVAELGSPKLREPIRLADRSEIAAGTTFDKAADELALRHSNSSATTLPVFKLPAPPAQQTEAYPKPFRAGSPVIENIDALVTPIDGFARTDRIVIWSISSMLQVFPAPDRKQLGPGVQIGERPKQSAWVENDALAVWGATQLTMLREDGKRLAWKIELSQLPPVEVLAGDEPEEGVTAIRNNVMQQQVFVVGNRVVRRNVLVAPAMIAQPPPDRPVGPEQIDDVVPASHHLLFSTTSGRVVCVQTDDGRVAWQVRLSDRPVLRVAGNEDFTVILSETNASVRLQVLDTFGGHVRGHRSFARSTNSYPQNIALCDDGTLVYTRQDRVCIKDLFKPWNTREIERALPAGPANFLGMSGPDQLVIAGNRILAVTDSGGPDRSGEKYVHIYSLDGGQPTMLKVGNKQQIEQALSCGSKSPGVRLKVVGSRLFTVASNACNAYDLDHLEQHESIFGQELPLSPVSDVLFGKDFLIFVGDDPDAPAPNAPAAAPPAVVLPIPVLPPQAVAPVAPPPAPPRQSLQLSAFGRYSTSHGEGTRLDYQQKVQDAAGITAEWQGFDGGVCYRTADRKLHLLQGAAPSGSETSH